jgi:hypothetical protein
MLSLAAKDVLDGLPKEAEIKIKATVQELSDIRVALSQISD